ncbi:MAG TPA: hypothetical protein VNR38_12860 [Ureibacillus sp.]|nr:hypothetical protein [Ureibacillus sp.]
MKDKKLRNYLIAIIVISILLSLKTIYDNRERSLADVMKYNQRDFNSLLFTQNIKEYKFKSDNWWSTHDNEPVEELMAFLSQYRVKKIKEDEFNQRNKNEIGIEFAIFNYVKDSKVVGIHENTVDLDIGEYYIVLNGPIDMEWISNYHEKYRELYD